MMDPEDDLIPNSSWEMPGAPPCRLCATPKKCPCCGDDLSEYTEDDLVYLTDDDRPYCSHECVVHAWRESRRPHPSHNSWLVELLMPQGHWHVAYPTHDRTKADARLALSRAESPDRQWRLVEETTTYTVVEETPASTQTAIPCNWAHTRWPHVPHHWTPQPGMDPAPCPGYAKEKPMTFEPVLTRNEKRALVLHANGKEKKEMATDIGVGTDALKNINQSVCTKLGAENVPHAIAIAFCVGLLALADIDGFNLPTRNTR